jgi:hypothetical protein
MYIRLGEDWMSAPAEGDLGSEFDMFSSDEFLSDTCGWKNQGETELNGVQVQHWTVSKEDVEACLPAADLEELGDITALSGDLYIAVDGNYVARMDMVMEGSNMDMGLGLSDEEISEGRIEISIEFTDVNEPFTIEVPEEAMAGAGLPQDIPVPPDAGAVSSMFGMITFESPSTAQEVADFYQAEMPNNGWTETGADDMGAIFMLEYEKDGRTASFMISTDQDTGVTSVLITLSE